MSNLKDFTIFVNGLPSNMNSRWLKNIFKIDGDIINVYISIKKRKSTKTIFSFVRFQYEKDADRAISSLDSNVINSNCLKVKWAKFKRVLWKLQT